MRSEAYERLYTLTWKSSLTVRSNEWIEGADEKDIRIAVYLGLLPGVWWMKDRKKKALVFVPGLTDAEWEIIREYMEQHAVTGTTPYGKRVRIDWIRLLDTFREFERE